MGCHRCLDQAETEGEMTRLLHDIEDYLEDASQAERMPSWAQRLMRALGRTIGETGDLIAGRFSRF